MADGGGGGGGASKPHFSISRRRSSSSAAAAAAEWLVWSLIWTASMTWIAWWILSSNQPRRLSKNLSDDPRLLSDATSGESSFLLFAARFLSADGRYGSAFLFQAIPMLVVALLSYAAVELRSARRRRRIDPVVGDDGRSAAAAAPTGVSAAAVARNIRSLRAYPVLVNGPLGVITAAELLCILALLSLLLYTVVRRTQLDFRQRHRHGGAAKTTSSVAKLGKASYNVGRSALILLSLLLIPVSRGSPLLRLLEIPFEQAVRYHVWLASLLLAMLTIHGVGYMAFYAASDRVRQILTWKSTGIETCSVAAGLAALCVGATMALTAQPAVRRRCYELFLFAHVALAPLFFLCCLYHAVWTAHFLLPAALLFAVDRFLRFRQSRNRHRLAAVRFFPCGAVELRQELPAICGRDEDYALSSWYVRVPAVSKLQWHMFSAVLVDRLPESIDIEAPTSLCRRRRRQLAFIIKPVGSWSRTLVRQLSITSGDGGAADSHRRSGINCVDVRLEGPYGHECAFYLTYRRLVLVAGGIGITPVLSLLYDVLLRHRRRSMDDDGVDLPATVVVYHCVRTLQELCILNSLRPERIFPNYSQRGLTIRVFAYVTGRQRTSVDDGSNLRAAACSPAVPAADHDAEQQTLNTASAEYCGAAGSDGGGGGCGGDAVMISSKGQTIWVAMTTLTVIVGFYALWGMTNVFLVKKKKQALLAEMGGSKLSDIYVRQEAAAGVLGSRMLMIRNYEEVHLVVGCILVATVVGGGVAALLWARTGGLRRRKLSEGGGEEAVAADVNGDVRQEWPNDWVSNWAGTVELGCRPCWTEIFQCLAKEFLGGTVGVLVSGPQGMQRDIAMECKRQTKFFGSEQSTVFHYHSVSFEI